MDKNESKADIGSVVGYSHMESRTNRNFFFFAFSLFLFDANFELEDIFYKHRRSN